MSNDMTNEIEQPLNHKQLFNEAVIRMAVVFYQIDGKVTLTEQDYFDNMTSKLEWTSGVVMPSFISQAIHEAREAIDQGTAQDYLRTLGNDLNINPAQALEVAMEITAVDGERSEEELELLSLLSNRILAKGLVA